MPTIGKNRDDPFHFFFETNLQYPVRLVDDKCFEVPEHEAFRVLVIPQTSKHETDISEEDSSAPGDDPTTDRVLRQSDSHP